MISNSSLIYKVCYLFAERNFNFLTSFVDMSDTAPCRILLISLLSFKCFTSYLLRFCSVISLSVTLLICRNYLQPNKNMHILQDICICFFQINSRSSFPLSKVFSLFIFYSTLYGLDLRCIYFYSSPHPHPHTSLNICFLIYFKDLNFVLFIF